MRLSPEQRILNTLEGREVDRLPVMDIFHNSRLMEHITGKTITKKNAFDVAAEAVGRELDLCRHFTIPDPDRFADSERVDEDGFVLRSNWWTGAYIASPLKTAAEARDQMKKDIERIRAATEEHRVISQAQVNLELPGENCATFEEIGEFFNTIAAKILPAVSVCPETEVGMYTALARYGFELFFCAWYDYPDVVREYYDTLTAYEVEKIRTYGARLRSPIAMLSEAVASNSGLLYRYEFIKEFIFPNVRSVIRAWQEAGKKVIFHSDGNRWAILDDIVAMGVDSINPCEALAGMTVKEFKTKYPRVTIGSVIDCQDLLPLGPVSAIEEASRQLLEDAQGNHVFLGSSSEIHPAIPVEHAMAMYRVLRGNG